jgi:hypothetical protein
MKRVLIYVLLGPLVGAATVFLNPWGRHPPVSVWQPPLLFAYVVGLPFALAVCIIDYRFRNDRWQWVSVVVWAGLVCTPLYWAHFWLVGIVPAAICSFLANFAKSQIRPLPNSNWWPLGWIGKRPANG